VEPKEQEFMAKRRKKKLSKKTVTGARDRGKRAKAARRGARTPTRKTVASRSSASLDARAIGGRLGMPIDAMLKATAIAAEPPINADPTNLDPAFRVKLDAALARLASDRRPFKFVEGFRTVERQQWLFGSGRPAVMPFGRPGPIVTNADGVTKHSNHQGDGIPGSGRAADCYPLRNGKVHIPPNTDPLWTAYASAVVEQGLVAGHNFSSIKDSPHCELK
jgi:hypothetical protein